MLTPSGTLGYFASGMDIDVAIRWGQYDVLGAGVPGLKGARTNTHFQSQYTGKSALMQKPVEVNTPTYSLDAAKGGGFGSMMEASEAARYAKYWQNYAPKQVTPGTTRLDWLRQSGRTGRMESSRVIYDNYGRQIYRVDFSNHMRPLNHSVPHLH